LPGDGERPECAQYSRNEKLVLEEKGGKKRCRGQGRRKAALPHQDQGQREKRSPKGKREKGTIFPCLEIGKKEKTSFVALPSPRREKGKDPWKKKKGNALAGRKGEKRKSAVSIGKKK